MTSYPEWIILVDGPLEGRKIDTWIGIVGIIPEVAYCNVPGCLVMHVITHEYGRDGRWRRSYSALRLSDGPEDVTSQ